MKRLILTLAFLLVASPVLAVDQGFMWKPYDNSEDNRDPATVGTAIYLTCEENNWKVNCGKGTVNCVVNGLPCEVDCTADATHWATTASQGDVESEKSNAVTFTTDTCHTIVWNPPVQYKRLAPPNGLIKVTE